MPKIEVLAIRDPDTETNVQIWIDGVRFDNYAYESVDPGAGHELYAWLGNQLTVMTNDDYSEGFKAAALAAYASYDDSEYVIQDDYGVEAPCPLYSCRWSADEAQSTDLETAAAAVREHMKTTHPEK
jgi:hypothetical protein